MITLHEQVDGLVAVQVDHGHGCDFCVFTTPTDCLRTDRLRFPCGRSRRWDRHEVIWMRLDDAAAARVTGRLRWPLIKETQ